MLADVIILVIFVLFSAFFSCAETAFMGVSRLKTETLAKQQVPGARTLLELKQQPRQFIIMVLIGNNVVNTGASALATILATKSFGSTGVGIATGVMTFILLTFGEILPKSYATSHGEKIALMLASPSMITVKAFYPLILIFEWIADRTLTLFGSADKTPLFSEAELRTLLEVGVKEQSLGTTEKSFIEGILEFRQCLVKEIMTPKRRIFSLNGKLPLSLALHEINRREHSRIPIYQGSKEQIVGIIYLKDVLATIGEQHEKLRLIDLARKPLLVDEETSIAKLFREMQVKHIHIALVVNKKQEIKGLITLEDIIEEIVGDIFDEKDISPTLIKRVSKTAIIAHADTEISYVNSFFNVSLPRREGMETLHQLLFSLQKKPLQEGTHVKYENLIFIIKDVEDGKPVKVLVKK